MEFKCQRLPLSQIDIDNDDYRISTSEVDNTLVQSIEALGVFNPPILVPHGPRFTIVTGFARIGVCHRIGMRDVPCHLMQPDPGPERCARIAVSDHAMHRELNLMEQANAIRLLAQVYTIDIQLLQAARECGLSVNLEMIRKLRKVGQMRSTLQNALSDGTIALPVALQLTEMDDASHVDALIQLFQEIRVGLNRQREIADWIVAIARRDDISVVELLNAGDLQRIRMDSELDWRQRGAKIRDYVKRMRYPTITRHETRYAHIVKLLKLQKGTNLSAPPNFEGQAYSLKFDFRSHAELVEKQNEFSRLVKSQAIKDLFNR